MHQDIGVNVQLSVHARGSESESAGVRLKRFALAGDSDVNMQGEVPQIGRQKLLPPIRLRVFEDQTEDDPIIWEAYLCRGMGNPAYGRIGKPKFSS